MSILRPLVLSWGILSLGVLATACSGTGTIQPFPGFGATPAATHQPTQSPTQQPTQQPTQSATDQPTQQPTQSPTQQPTQSPTQQPTQSPTQQPTQSPTQQPTQSPTQQPTQSPTQQPTQSPTQQPTQSPTQQPTQSPTQQPTQSPTTAPSGNTWTGTFTGLETAPWVAEWGASALSWGTGNVATLSDPTAPGTGDVIKVHYAAGSSSNSASGGTGGTQFYSYIANSASQKAVMGSGLPTSAYLKYNVKFTSGFDFGRAGKMPGMFGGPGPGCASGGNHCPGAWSTRLMWRGAGQAQCGNPCNGELYLYTDCVGGFGQDLGLGNWKFPGDGNWHSIEEFVDISADNVIVWFDGTQAFQTKLNCPADLPISGIFFSTFYGGSGSNWGPHVGTDSYFANFQLSKTKI